MVFASSSPHSAYGLSLCDTLSGAGCHKAPAGLHRAWPILPFPLSFHPGPGSSFWTRAGAESRCYRPRCAPVQPYTGQAGKMNATSGVSDMSGGRRPVVRRSGAVRPMWRLSVKAAVQASLWCILRPSSRMRPHSPRNAGTQSSLRRCSTSVPLNYPAMLSQSMRPRPTTAVQASLCGLRPRHAPRCPTPHPHTSPPVRAFGNQFFLGFLAMGRQAAPPDD